MASKEAKKLSWCRVFGHKNGKVWDTLEMGTDISVGFDGQIVASYCTRCKILMLMGPSGKWWSPEGMYQSGAGKAFIYSKEG